MTRNFASIERMASVACATLFFEVMFAHLTAIENIALAVIGVGLIAATFYGAMPPVRRWPIALPVAMWGAWTLASVAWSIDARVSLHGWLDEVCYPLIGFFACWWLVSRAAQPRQFALANWLACIGLALLSAILWGKLQPDNADVGLFHFYNRVGHTSTLAIMAMPLMTAMLFQGRYRWLGVSGLTACLFIGLASLNRFFWPAAAVTLLIALVPLYRRHVALTIVVVALMCVAGFATLQLSSRLRFGAEPLHAPARLKVLPGTNVQLPAWLSSFDDELSTDTRPRLWSYYVEAGKANAWTGVGFGKNLPGKAYGPSMPAALLQVEAQARTHAHNILLNTWLEVGTIGVALQVVLFGALISRFARLRRVAPWVGAGGVALVVGMIAKNMTDDLMWRTTMLAFWCFAGYLLGYGERIAGNHDGLQPSERGSVREVSDVLGA